MIRLAVLIGALGGPALAQDVPVPSGTPMTLFDVVIEQAPDIARFRFLAPAIGSADSEIGFVDVVDDLQFLCDKLALPALRESAWDVDEIVISLSAEELEFGASAPDVMQFFQPFTVAEDGCIWEDF